MMWKIKTCGRLHYLKDVKINLKIPVNSSNKKNNDFLKELLVLLKKYYEVIPYNVRCKNTRGRKN